jgi:hypothetical protein
MTPLSPLGSVRIIEDIRMTDPVEDWSLVRSRSRGERRRRQGHRQNVRIIHVPKREAMKLPDGTLVLHPAVAAELRRQLHEKIESEYLSVLSGWRP